jgi:hypothetical protein
MATGTLGTTANNSLTSKQFVGAMAPADIASIANAIKNEQINGRPIWPGAWAQTGLLYVPNRGVLKLLPGDYVGVDSQGWPVLVSANSIANAAWTHVGG